MIFLKSSILVTLFLISNINAFKFPDYLKNKRKTESKTSTITESSQETINLTENQNESNIEVFCGTEASENYCTDPFGYPEETILKAVVGQQGILQSFFDVSSIDPSTVPSIDPRIVGFNTFAIEEIFYDDVEFENVCSTRTEHITPRAARNTKGEFMFIVNNPKGNYSFTQKVQVGKCVNAGNECGDGAVFDAKTECHQEFLEHKLVSISKDGDHVVVDTFEFPSCCTCRIIKDTF